MSEAATYKIEVDESQQMNYGVTSYELVFTDSTGATHAIDAYALYQDLKEYFGE